MSLLCLETPNQNKKKLSFPSISSILIDMGLVILALDN